MRSALVLHLLILPWGTVGCGGGAPSGDRPAAGGMDGRGAGPAGDAGGVAAGGDGGATSSDPCAAARLGDGASCGSSLGAGDPATLYQRRRQDGVERALRDRLPRRPARQAARAGIVTVAANVTGPGQACYDGCTQPFGSDAFWACCNGCLGTSNHVNAQHADGTVATYWHLDVATVGVGDHGRLSHGPSQSVSITFANEQKPICGNVETSDNDCHQRQL